jgi:hypothetical protein
VTHDESLRGRPVCLRCGNFAEPDGVLVPGLPLCKECFPGISTRQRYRLPPWSISLRKTWPAALVALATFVVTTWVVLPEIALLLTPSLLPGSVPGIACEIALTFLLPALGFGLGMLTFATVVQHGGNRQYKTHILSQLGLAEDAGAAFKLVAYGPYSGRAGFPEVGLLLEGDGGLVFLGRRGTQLGIPSSEIRSVGTGRGEPNWPLLQLRVELAAGNRVWFRFLEGPSFAANSALAREAARRLEVTNRPG